MSLRRREAGRVSGGALLLVAIGLAAAGAWNYHRNLAREEASRAARPLAGYSTADLEALADAYRGQVEAGNARYERSRAGRASARERAYFDEQVQEFEKVQRESSRVRDASAALAEDEASLRAVESELAARRGASGAWETHWRRLTSF
jgi:hypothetical protein